MRRPPLLRRVAAGLTVGLLVAVGGLEAPGVGFVRGASAGPLERRSAELLEGLALRRLSEVRLENASLEDVLQVFEQLSGRRIVLEERVERKVAIQIQDVAWPKALTDLLAPLGLRWFAEGEVLRVEIG